MSVYGDSIHELFYQNCSLLIYKWLQIENAYVYMCTYIIKGDEYHEKS